MYAIYRRIFGTPDWGEPLVNVPGAGIATLEYTDGTVVPLTRYEYAITALDCTPAPSAFTPVSNILIIP
jgi:hypothetical protein